MKPFDLDAIPFSYPGAYFRVSPLWVTAPGRRLAIGTVFGPGVRNVWELALVRGGRELRLVAEAQPHELVLTAGGARATLAFADRETVSFSIEGAELRLLPRHGFGWVASTADGGCLISDPVVSCYHHARAARGTELHADSMKLEEGRGTACRLTFRAKGPARGALRIAVDERPWDGAVPLVEGAARACRAEWHAWRARMPLSVSCTGARF
jgi:hypothetical protein